MTYRRAAFLAFMRKAARVRLTEQQADELFARQPQYMRDKINAWLTTIKD